MQTRLRTNVFHCVLVLAFAHGFQSTTFPKSALAQGPEKLGPVSQSSLIGRIAQTAPGDLTAADVIRVYKLHPQLGSSKDLGVWESMFDQIIWTWAAERGLDVDVAISQLSRAYEQEFGQLDVSLMRRLRRELQDLPSPSIGVYRAPSYVPRGLAHKVRRSRRIGRPPFGPIEKNGISRLSIGLAGPSLPAGP